jgi:hypothetical protein
MRSLPMRPRRPACRLCCTRGTVRAKARCAAVGAMAILACCLPMYAGAGTQAAIEPHAWLVYETRSERGDGQWRLRALPEGREEWVLWEWTNDPWERTLSASYCAISGDWRHALFVQSWSALPSYFPDCTFALADLAEPINGGKSMTITKSFYLVDYPVWLDNSRFVFGVADDPEGTEGCRQIQFDAATGAMGPGPQPPYDFATRNGAQIERTAQALDRLPQALVPEDLRPPRQLVLAPDGQGVTHRFPAARGRSYASLSPSGRQIAVADRGDSLTVVALETGAQRHTEALPLLLREGTAIKHVRWSPDEAWVLFTEEHYQSREMRVGVMDPPGSRKVVSLVRALDVASGEVLTLVAGENGFWVPRPSAAVNRP